MTRLRQLRRAWALFGKALSKVTSPVLLGMTYYLLVTPTGVLLRLVGRDPLATTGGDTFWKRRTKPRSDLTRQF